MFYVLFYYVTGAQTMVSWAVGDTCLWVNELWAESGGNKWQQCSSAVVPRLWLGKKKREVEIR